MSTWIVCFDCKAVHASNETTTLHIRHERGPLLAKICPSCVRLRRRQLERDRLPRVKKQPVARKVGG